MKIGSNDELAAWHLKRCELQTRAPMYYLLNEKTRLAGCHLIREAVERVILEEGIERFQRFSREVIEEGRRSFKARTREMTVPGRYRSPAFCEFTLEDKEPLPAQARLDLVMHSPFEVRIGGDGTYELDYDGCSAWGHHSLNCT
ncbi:MAG TPA: hydantoinase B/oxoprolinase family protein, partial [Solirubrobacterales bacterium]|nr:hydantoinase B/oxoprolinase family protein [Solirubrobacterales bacterium]